MPDRIKLLSARRLTIWYLAGLLVVASVSVGFHAVFRLHYQRSQDLAAIINLSGRQRMLSQRIAGLATEYRQGDPTARAPLLLAADQFEAGHNKLLAINLREASPDAQTAEIRAIYCDGAFPLNAAVRQYAGDARDVASLPPGAPGAKSALAAIATAARAPLLASLDRVTQLQQQRTEAALRRLDKLETAAMLMILVTLITEAGFVFRPLVRSMVAQVQQANGLAESLANEHELLHVTMHSMGDGVITTDAQGNVSWLNPIAEKLTGWNAGHARNIPIEQVFPIYHQETGDVAENPVRVALAEGRISGLAAQSVLRSRHGDVCGVEDSAAPIRNSKGNTIGAVLVFRDVTQQRRLAGEMTHRATHDALTGLINRAEFEHRMEYLLHKAHADRSENALLFIDLDQFKLVNDNCGHAAGDQLLAQVAKLLISMVRGSDTVARLGGDEFAILLDRCPIENANALAQKICDQMEEFRFTYDGKRFRVGASIGLAPLDSRWADSVALMNAADAACYAAKAAGRNRVHGWSETDLAIRMRHGEAQWAAKLEQALEENLFVLFAQRIHDCANGESSAHAEILLRLRDHDGKLLLPGIFMPAAERFNMAPRVDRWVVSNALSWMRAQPSIFAIEMLAINLSGQSVSDTAFQRWILAEIADFGPRIAQRICLEITETAAVINLADATAFIKQLQALGVRVALDDFGSGASSFGYLKNMPVDFLKIDGQFVRDILTDRLDAAAVRCFIEVARVAGMKTIAEFTETAEVLDGLQAMGINYAQGYHIHMPAPIDELMATIRLVDAEPSLPQS